MKRFFEYLSQFLKYLLIVGIIVSVVYSLGSFLVTGYPKFFNPQLTIVSANVTDFNTMTLKKDMDCKPGESYSSFSLDFSFVPAGALSEYKVASSNPIQFSIVLPEGKLAIKKYIDGKSEYTDFFSVKSKMEYTGTITGLAVEFGSEFVSIQENICAQEIHYEPDFGMISIPHDPKMYQWGSTSQYMHSDDQVKVIIEGPLELINFPDEKIEKLELTIISAADGQYTNIHTTSQGLALELPTTGSQFSFWEGERLRSSRLRASPDEIIIEIPVGTLRLGNEDSIQIGGLTKFNNEKVAFEKSVLPNERYAVSGNIDTAVYEISGATTGIVLNDEQLVRSPWDKLPDYIKSALFGLLLAGIGGIWKFRGSIGGWIKSLIPFWKKVDIEKPPKGSFTCVTISGMVIAGELSRKPAKNYPYYLLKNARRKVKPSDQWGKEIIPEIKVREDSVEQSYVV